MKKNKTVLTIVYSIILIAIISCVVYFVFFDKDEYTIDAEEKEMIVSSIYAYNYKNNDLYTVSEDEYETDMVFVASEFNKSMLNIEFMLFNTTPKYTIESQTNTTTCVTVTFYGLNNTKVKYSVTYSKNNSVYTGSVVYDDSSDEFCYRANLTQALITDEDDYYYYNNSNENTHIFSSTNLNYETVSLCINDLSVTLVDYLNNSFEFTLLNSKIYVDFINCSILTEYTLEISLDIETYEYIYLFQSAKTSVQIEIKRV